ncbi:MAG: redoxin domain-containing protein [Planctomycetes bacterium]|nr:redoxin domain-containing protein [Planctomycetota bacterium]
MRRGFQVCACLALVLSSPPAWAADASGKDRLGRVVSDAALTDYRGASVSMADVKEKPIVVLAFLGTECPLAKLAVTKLNLLAKDFEPRGVVVLGINSNRQDSLADLAAQAKKQDVAFRLWKDAGNKLADAVGAVRTPEVVVLDQQRAIRYVGRIDDQDGIGYRRETANRQDLKAAIEELLAGKPVSVATTEVEGCFIGKVREAKRGAEVTYSKQVAPILQNRCMNCHRQGQVAPFAMTSYDEVVGWAETIAEVVQDNRMPPWHANPDHGKFANARNLPDHEKRVLLEWVQAGAPEGDRIDLPPVRSFTDGWQLPREPDLIVNMRDKPFNVPASGTVRYQYFSVDPKLTEDKWVTAAEIQPGERSVVHHVLVFAKTDAELRKFDGEGAFLAAYVPGFLPQQYPTGMAKLVPAGAKLIFQVHYTPNGRAMKDVSRIGLLFADEESITHAVITSEARKSGGLIIPPNANNSRHEANSPKSPVDVQLLNLMPHMHVRGKSFRYELQTADGRKETVLDVPRYDFNWQTSYQLAEPMLVPAASSMHVVAHYDNSENNLNNPNPKATVRWGEQTWNEMLIGYFDVAIPREAFDASRKTAAGTKPKAPGTNLPPALLKQIVEQLEQLDVNKDGILTASEVPARLMPIFKRLDVDGDEKLTVEEVQKAIEKKQ